ncbi:MAG TPA: sigma factor-like helix-turn-helix DNA-binding protein, partial [bacterium]|nr:sigma factor-like helix-turn-helix DNA-binding protein [bacterium]
RDPDQSEIARAARIKLEKVHKLQRLAQRSLSLEVPVSDDPNAKSMGDFIEDKGVESPAQSTFRRLRSEKIHRLIHSLNDKEQQVLAMRFGFEAGSPRTLEQTGKCLGVTRERIRQIEEKALQKIRSLMRASLEEYRDLLHEFA